MEIFNKIITIISSIFCLGFLFYLAGRIFGLSFSKSFFAEKRKEKGDGSKKDFL